jgi:hypothetical protein
MATPIDHNAKSIERLLTQYKSTPNLKAILASFIEQAQGIEDMMQGFEPGLGLPTAIGQQLDNLGVTLGQPRQGVDDDTYRILLYTKIVQNFSEGNIETLIDIYSVLMGSSTIILQEIYPAGFMMMAIDPAPIGEEDLIALAIQEAKVAGVGIGWLAIAISPAFVFLDDVIGTVDGYGTVWDTSLGGIFARLIGLPINDPLDDYAHEEHFEGFAAETDLVGVGEDTFTYRPHLANTGTALVKDISSNKLVRFVTSDVGWGGFSYNGARALKVSDGIWRWRNKNNTVRTDVVFKWTAAGGYLLQWIASSELRLKKLAPNWEPVTGEAILDSNDPAAPATLDEIIVRCEGNRIRCYADKVLVFDYVDDTLASGTYGVRSAAGAAQKDIDDMSVTELHESIYDRNFNDEADGTNLVGAGDDEFEAIVNSGVGGGFEVVVASTTHAWCTGGLPGKVTYRRNGQHFDGSGNYDIFHRIESTPGGQADFGFMHTDSGGYMVSCTTGATTIYRFDQKDPYASLISLGAFSGEATLDSCKIKVIGNEIHVFVNDIFKGKVVDATYRSGSISYGAVNFGFQFDDIDVRKTKKFTLHP